MLTGVYDNTSFCHRTECSTERQIPFKWQNDSVENIFKNEYGKCVNIVSVLNVNFAFDYTRWDTYTHRHTVSQATAQVEEYVSMPIFIFIFF